MAYRPRASGLLEIKRGAGAWNRLRMLTAFAISPTTGSPTTEDYIDEASVQVPGSPGLPTWSTTVATNEALQAFRDLEEAFFNEETVSIRASSGKLSLILSNAVAADTIAIAAATGIVTALGGIDFGTADVPKAPWDHGRIIVAGAHAWCLEEIRGAKSARVSYLGPVAAQTFAAGQVPYGGDGDYITPSTIAIPALAATQNWKVVEFGVLVTGTGSVTNAGGMTVDPQSRSTTVEGTFSARPTRQFRASSS